MEFTNRYRGALDYLRSRWPQYLLAFGALTLLVVLLAWFSLRQEWYAFTVLAFAASLVLVYFGLASLWAAHQLYDGDHIASELASLGAIDTADVILQISPGLQSSAVGISQRLTIGRVEVIDIYNPQLISSPVLARFHRNARYGRQDPRLVWLDGAIDLLPKTDNSVETVILVETASALWQHGDRECLLKEIHRILQPDGQLLFAERCRTLSNILTIGPAGIRLPSTSYWQRLLEGNGFQVVDSADIGDLMHFLRAIKPPRASQRRLPLDL